MARKPQTIIEVIAAENRSRQAHQAHELQRMNEAALRSQRDNRAVLQAGVLRNALGGLLPFVIPNDQDLRRRRGQK